MEFTIVTRTKLPPIAKVLMGNTKYYFYRREIGKEGTWPFNRYTCIIEDNSAPRTAAEAFLKEAHVLIETYHINAQRRSNIGDYS